MNPTGPAKPFRLERSLLSVPAINPKLFAKAIASDADVIMLDCEDSVAENDKAAARANCIQALMDFEWREAGKTILVRINDLTTPFAYRDVIEVVEAAGPRLDGLMLPKTRDEQHISFLDCLLDQIEKHKGYQHKIHIEALIETVHGVANIQNIAAASERLEALHFGAGDFAASCGSRTVSIGGLPEGYPGDPCLPAMHAIVVACRMNGLRPIDSAYGDFKDIEGYIASLRRAAVLGFEGKWAIHPSQIEYANREMTPSPEQIQKAKLILEKMREAEAEGRAAVNLDGEMIDVASVRMAEVLVSQFNTKIP